MARAFRVHARRPVRLRALLTHLGSGGQREVRIVDIGLGGARLSPGEPGEPLRPGDALTLTFSTPTLWDPLVIRARVAWVGADPSAGANRPVGIAFEHEHPDALFALYELIGALAYD